MKIHTHIFNTCDLALLLSFVIWAGFGAGLLTAGSRFWEGDGWMSNLVMFAGHSWVRSYLGWVGDIRGRRVVLTLSFWFHLWGSLFLIFFLWSIGTKVFPRLFITWLVASWRHYGWVRSCSMSGDDINPGGIRQVWLGGLFFRCSQFSYPTPMSETNIGFRNLCVVTNLFCRLVRVCRWYTTNTPVFRTLFDKCCCKLIYWALGRWLMIRVWTPENWMQQDWRVSRRLACHNERWLQFESKECRGKMGKYPAVISWVFRRHQGGHGLMYLKAPTSQVKATILMKDQMQNIIRAGGLCSKSTLIVKTCWWILLAKKSRPIFNYVGQGVMSLLQASDWFIKSWNQDVKKGYGARKRQTYWAYHIGLGVLGRDFPLAWLIYQVWGENHFGLNTMRHVLFKSKWAHRKNSSFGGPHLCFDTRWSDSVSGYNSCKFGLMSPCKARFLFIHSVGNMISYFWSPKLVLDDVTGGMPP
ncbi:hypothetical protein Hanom_Chr09g00763411 [Helianthus anomalus]